MMPRRLRDSRADAEATHAVVTAAFDDVEWSESGIVRFQGRVRHLAATDPDGCWPAEDEAGRPLGAALATCREGLWGLSLLAVDRRLRGGLHGPDHSGRWMSASRRPWSWRPAATCACAACARPPRTRLAGIPLNTRRYAWR